MPVQILPQSRRRFFGSAALLAAAPLFKQTVFSAESENWALLSDIHIAADPTTVSRQGTNMAENLKKVVKEVVAEKNSLTGVIINGDCAYNSGLPEDYETVTELLKPITEAGLPIHITLGNHDERNVLAEKLGTLKGSGVLADKRCTVVETPLVRWILLDSLLNLGRVEGELGDAQIAWLAEQVADAKGKPAIVMTHHYPQMEPKDYGDGKPARYSGLVDTKALYEVLNNAPVVKSFIWGHSHSYDVEQTEKGDFHRANLPTTAYVFKPGKPQGWVRSTVTANGMDLELRCIDTTHPQHGEKHQFTWR